MKIRSRVALYYADQHKRQTNARTPHQTPVEQALCMARTLAIKPASQVTLAASYALMQPLHVVSQTLIPLITAAAAVPCGAAGCAAGACIGFSGLGSPVGPAAQGAYEAYQHGARGIGRTLRAMTYGVLLASELVILALGLVASTAGAAAGVALVLPYYAYASSHRSGADAGTDTGTNASA